MFESNHCDVDHHYTDKGKAAATASDTIAAIPPYRAACAYKGTPPIAARHEKNSDTAERSCFMPKLAMRTHQLKSGVMRKNEFHIYLLYTFKAVSQ